MRKKYSNIRNSAHVASVLSRLRQAMEKEDAECSLRELSALSECEIFSNHEATYQDWNSLRPALVKLLFERLPLERFLEIPLSDYVVSIYDLGKPIANSLTTEQAIRLLEHFEEPLPEWMSVLRTGGEEISRRLEQLILRLLQKKLSYLEVTSLCVLVTELVRRQDGVAAEATERFLGQPPWTDNRLDQALWQGLARFPGKRGQALLEEAVRERPNNLELLRAYAQLAPKQAATIVLEALAEWKGDREDVFRWLVRLTDWPATPPETLQTSPLKRWSPLEKAYFSEVVRFRAPAWSLPSLHTRWGRMQLSLIRAFGSIRLPVLGVAGILVISLPIYFWLYESLLTRVVGEPTRWLPLDSVAALLWAISSMMTSAPDFNPGMEGPRELWTKACLHLGATAFLLAAPVLQRL